MIGVLAIVVVLAFVAVLCLLTDELRKSGRPQ